MTDGNTKTTERTVTHSGGAKKNDKGRRKWTGGSKTSPFKEKVNAIAALDEHDIVLIKFSVKPEDDLPAGVPFPPGDEVQRKSEGSREERAADVDPTKYNLISTQMGMSAPNILTEMVMAGYSFGDIHQRAVKNNEGTLIGKTIICGFYRPGAGKGFGHKPTEKQINAIAELAAIPFRRCNVWLNPDQAATVNFVEPQWTRQKPAQQLKVVKTALQVEQPVTD